MKNRNAKTSMLKLEVEKDVNSTRKLYWFLAILTFLLFANTLRNGYNMDDELVTRNHPLTSQGLSAIKDIFTSPYYKDDMGYSYGYRPIVHLSFALEHEIFGEKVAVSHFFNLVLFAISVLLLFRFLLKLFSSKHVNAVFLATLIFCIHPIHVEVVASIKNRDEILAFLFSILSFLQLLKFLEDEKKWFNLITASLFFLSGILSKNSVFPLIFLVPFILVKLRNANFKTTILGMTIYLLPSILVFYNLPFQKLLLFVVAPVFWTTIVYFSSSLNSKEGVIGVFKQLWNNYNSLLVLSLFFAALAIIFINELIFILTVPFILGCLRLKKEKTLLIFSWMLILMFYYFENSEYSVLSVILSFSAFLELFESNRDTKRHLINSILLILAVPLIDIILGNDLLGSISRSLGMLIFISLLFYRVKIAFIVLIILLVLTNGDLFNTPMFYLILILLTLQSFNKKLLFYATISFVVVAALSKNSKWILENFTNSKPKMEKQLVYNSKPDFNESRKVEYVENTLIAPHSKSERIATGFSTIGSYVKTLIFPAELSFYYGYSKIKTVNFSDLKVWLSVVFFSGLLLLFFKTLNSNTTISFGILWFVVSILLFSNWVELVAGMVGERLAFTASAGFSIFIAGVIYWLKPDLNPKKPRLVEFFVILIVILLAVRTISRNSAWINSITLMSKDIGHLQNSAQANNLLALNYLRQSTDIDTVKLAMKHFKQAVKIYPDFFNVQFDLARTSMMIGDTSKAITHFKKVITLDPTFPVPFFSLIDIYASKGNWKDYKEIAEKLHYYHRQPNSYIILSRAYLEQNQKYISLKVLTQGLERYPENNDIKFCLNDLKTKI
jgi:tetratricopeptide (TPR) repeat protein